QGFDLRNPVLKVRTLEPLNRGVSRAALRQAVRDRISYDPLMNREFLRAELQSLRDAHLYRSLRHVDGAQGPTLFLDDREVINFSSNNYLGIANHPALCAAAKAAIDRYGCGSGASRLISGNMALHEELEAQLAQFKGT